MNKAKAEHESAYWYLLCLRQPEGFGPLRLGVEGNCDICVFDSLEAAERAAERLTNIEPSEALFQGVELDREEWREIAADHRIERVDMEGLDRVVREVGATGLVFNMFDPAGQESLDWGEE